MSRLTTISEKFYVVLCKRSNTCYSAPLQASPTAEALRYVARTKQRRTYLPYTFPAVAGTHLPTPKTMEGWVNPGPGCKEQLAHSCYATACGQLDWNPDLVIVSPAR